MPRKEYQPRKKGQSSSSSNIVEAQESDSQDTIMLEDWDNWFRPGTSTLHLWSQLLTLTVMQIQTVNQYHHHHVSHITLTDLD